MQHRRAATALVVGTLLALALSTLSVPLQPLSGDSSETPLVSMESPFRTCGRDPSGLGLCLTLDESALSRLSQLAVGQNVELRSFPLGLNQRGVARVSRFSVAGPSETSETSETSESRTVVLLRGAIYTEADVAKGLLLSTAAETFAFGAERPLFLALSVHGSNGYAILQGHTYILTTPWASVDGSKPEVDAYVASLRKTAQAMQLLSSTSTSASTHASVVYDATAADIRLDAMQLAPPRAAPASAPFNTTASSSSSSSTATRRAYAVAADVDYDMYRTKGYNYDATVSFYYTLLGSADAIYARDFGANLYNSYLKVYTSPDPYPCCSSGQALDHMVRTWNPSSPYRALATLVSAKNLGGGIAYVRVLCYTPYAYAVNGNMVGYFPVPLRSYDYQNWDIYVFAHELGHVFGASHTHDLNPPADRCGTTPGCGATYGTIMSYCHLCQNGLGNIDLVFHQYTKNEVIPYINGVSC